MTEKSPRRHRLDFRLAKIRSARRRIASGHNQRAPAKFPGDGAGIIDRARAEDDARGGGKFKFHICASLMVGRASSRAAFERYIGSSGASPHHAYHSSSSGNTLLNFTLKRGSAIMGATASRQTG